MSHAITQKVIYFSLPRFLQGTESHAAALSHLQQGHPGATILDPTVLWRGKSMQEWAESFPHVLAQVTEYYIVPDLDGTVGRATYEEWAFFADNQTPAFAFFPEGVLPVVGMRVIGGGENWRRYARVLRFADLPEMPEVHSDDAIPF